MCSGRLSWNSAVPLEYRKWIMKSDNEVAVLHRNLHSTVIYGMDCSVLYKKDDRRVGYVVSGNTSSISIDGRMSHLREDQWELSSMNYMDRITINAWSILSRLKNETLSGTPKELIEMVDRLNSLVAA